MASDSDLCIMTDVEKRTKDYTHPQVDGTIEDFLRNLHNQNCIQFILDLPYTGRGIPDHLRRVIFFLFVTSLNFCFL